MVLVFYCFSSAKRTTVKNSKKVQWLAIITVIILGSGTGYMLLLLFFIFKVGPFKNIFNASISLFLIALLYFLIFVLDIGSFNGLNKISSFYIEFLVDFKLDQNDVVYHALHEKAGQIWIGKQFQSAADLIIWSDFAWNDLFYCAGYIGFYVVVLIFIVKANRYNYIPLLIFAIGALHYGAAFSLPGQLLLGYFMSTIFKIRAREAGGISKIEHAIVAN